MCGYLHRNIHTHKHTCNKMMMFECTDLHMHTNTKHRNLLISPCILIYTYTHAHPTLVHTQAHTSMYTYSYVQAHTFKHTYKHALINTYIHLQTHIYAWPTHTPIYAQIYSHMHAHSSTLYTHIHLQICANTHANIYMHAYMQKHVIHLCLYTCMDIYVHFILAVLARHQRKFGQDIEAVWWQLQNNRIFPHNV